MPSLIKVFPLVCTFIWTLFLACRVIYPWFSVTVGWANLWTKMFHTNYWNYDHISCNKTWIAMNVEIIIFNLPTKSHCYHDKDTYFYNLYKLDVHLIPACKRSICPFFSFAWILLVQTPLLIPIDNMLLLSKTYHKLIPG